MRVWLFVIAVAACEKSSPAPEPVVPDRDQLLSAIAVDSITYMEQLSGILLAFDGDCPAHATRLLVLEPLVSSIRTRSAELSADEVRGVRERMAARKTEVLAKLDAQLAEKHATRADVEAKEAAIKTACANDPKVMDAMDRVGLFKKAK
jgi:hypothetical protein